MPDFTNSFFLVTVIAQTAVGNPYFTVDPLPRAVTIQNGSPVQVNIASSGVFVPDVTYYYWYGASSYFTTDEAGLNVILPAVPITAGLKLRFPVQSFGDKVIKRAEFAAFKVTDKVLARPILQKQGIDPAKLEQGLRHKSAIGRCLPDGEQILIF